MKKFFYFLIFITNICTLDSCSKSDDETIDDIEASVSNKEYNKDGYEILRKVKGLWVYKAVYWRSEDWNVWISYKDGQYYGSSVKEYGQSQLYKNLDKKYHGFDVGKYKYYYINGTGRVYTNLY